LAPRFNAIFSALMGLGFLCAFVLPARLMDVGGVRLTGILLPISRPVYQISTSLRRRLEPTPSSDTRPSDDLIQENLQLRQQIAHMQMEIEELQAQAGERQRLGDLQSLCDRFSVAAADMGSHQGLTLGPFVGGLAVNQPVVCGSGLVGKIDRVGEGSAHVRLITDPGSIVEAQFVRYVTTPAGIQVQAVGHLLPIIQGAGEGKLLITNLPLADVSQVVPGDWLVVADDSFSQAVQREPIGRVSAYGPWAKAPLFAEIKVDPAPGLTRLSDVWVQVRGN
jgi:cell shape-determining protein MreC